MININAKLLFTFHCIVYLVSLVVLSIIHGMDVFMFGATVGVIWFVIIPGAILTDKI